MRPIGIHTPCTSDCKLSQVLHLLGIALQTNESRYNPRQFRLGLTWRFGKTSINFKHARKTEVSDKL